MQILGNSESGNCLRVRWLADLLAIPYTWVEVDIFAGASRTPEYLAINPAGQVPAVIFDDGRVLAQSNAILLHLAAGSDLLPADPYDRAKVTEWLFWEQYSHEPYVAVCRTQLLHQGKTRDQLEPWRVERGIAALRRLDDHLAGRDWLVGATMTIADIALVSYSRVAHEGGFDTRDHAALRAWIARCEAALGLPAAT